MASGEGAGAISPLSAAVVIAALAVGWLLLPFSGVLAAPERFELINALADDTFYYLTIARNFARVGFPSFDGELLSNGYMPMWQWTVIGIEQAIGGADREPLVLMQAVFLASLGLVAVGMAGLAGFLGARLGALRAAAVLPLLLPGAVFWLFEPAWRFELPDGITYGLSPWSFPNGMESGLGLALFAVLLPLLARIGDGEAMTARRALLLGFLCWLIAMARLDDVFLGIAVFVPVAAASLRARTLRPALAFALVPVGGMLAFVLVNLWSAGIPLPSSGMSKTALFSWPAGLEQFSRVGLFRPEAQLLLPLMASVGIGTAALLLGRGLAGWRGVLCRVLGLYLLLKGVFLFSSIPLAHQGYWYYTIMLASANLLVAIAVADRLAGLQRGAMIAVFVMGLMALWPSAQATQRGLDLLVPGSTSETDAHLCRDAAAIRARLAEATGRPEADLRILDSSDGIHAYCLDLPTQSLTGLSSAPQVLRERREQGLFKAALGRGYDIVAGNIHPLANSRFELTANASGFDAVLVLQVGNNGFWRIVPSPAAQTAGAE